MTQVAKKQSTRKPKTEEQVLAEMAKPVAGDYVVARVDVPMQDPDPSTFVGRHSGRIDTNLDSGDQRENFRQVYSALKLNNYTLKNGRHVDSANDVIKWIFENIAV